MITYVLKARHKYDTNGIEILTLVEFLSRAKLKIHMNKISVNGGPTDVLSMSFFV